MDWAEGRATEVLGYLASCDTFKAKREYLAAVIRAERATGVVIGCKEMRALFTGETAA